MGQGVVGDGIALMCTTNRNLSTAKATVNRISRYARRVMVCTGATAVWLCDATVVRFLRALGWRLLASSTTRVWRGNSRVCVWCAGGVRVVNCAAHAVVCAAFVAGRQDRG